MADSADFYANLPVIEDFFNASNQENFHPLPDNWYVAVTDIVNSTDAIQNNRYKEVNILGASPIVGIFNIADRNTIPFTFGGDGASFCFPPHLIDDARRVLGGCKTIGKTEYNLDLRAAIIPLSYIREQGYDIQVARYRASEFYIQSIFSGGGLSFAERILKNLNSDTFRVPALENAQTVDFSGLECRWQKVEQPQNEVITMMIKANPNIDHPQKIYEQVFQKIRTTFGFDEKTNPINIPELSMTLSFSKLMGEARFRTHGQGWLKRIGYILKVQLQTIIGKVLMALDYETTATNWSLYKSDLAQNSDYRKFDDMLRLVISGSESERKEFVNFLEEQFRNEKLAFGIHLSKAAMITCMVFQYHRDHIHFVDGSGGGYVSAAEGLKKRLKKL
ncbi:DUF3095 domain-containing protein [Fodinibius sp.]|uniref:DUF3095 domain-containing protein n=1 Tax=Fodinibius sp. TaxID=1872440 RepID=UPI002ACE20AA|nr:DUF3095 domain-containing protein [Fodinibius sp.]MDZ7659037.1 DUF3095 domain-containing protein [Fodinibius sp.]